LLAGFLGCGQLPPRGFSLSFCGTLMSSDVTEALPDRKLLDFGGTFMGGPGHIVALQFAVARFLVMLMSELDVLGSTLHVVVRDGLTGGKPLVPAQKLLGTAGGFVTA
jgi:hypothetical protein